MRTRQGVWGVCESFGKSLNFSVISKTELKSGEIPSEIFSLKYRHIGMLFVQFPFEIPPHPLKIEFAIRSVIGIWHKAFHHAVTRHRDSSRVTRPSYRTYKTHQNSSNPFKICKSIKSPHHQNSSTPLKVHKTIKTYQIIIKSANN